MADTPLQQEDEFSSDLVKAVDAIASGVKAGSTSLNANFSALTSAIKTMQGAVISAISTLKLTVTVKKEKRDGGPSTRAEAGPSVVPKVTREQRMADIMSVIGAKKQAASQKTDDIFAAKSLAEEQKHNNKVAEEGNKFRLFRRKLALDDQKNIGKHQRKIEFETLRSLNNLLKTTTQSMKRLEVIAQKSAADTTRHQEKMTEIAAKALERENLYDKKREDKLEDDEQKRQDLADKNSLRAAENAQKQQNLEDKNEQRSLENEQKQANFEAEAARKKLDAAQKQLNFDVQEQRKKDELAQKQLNFEAELARKVAEAAQKKMNFDAELARKQFEAALKQANFQLELDRKKFESTLRQMNIQDELDRKKFESTLRQMNIQDELDRKNLEFAAKQKAAQDVLDFKKAEALREQNNLINEGIKKADEAQKARDQKDKDAAQREKEIGLRHGYRMLELAEIAKGKTPSTGFLKLSPMQQMLGEIVEAIKSMVNGIIQSFKPLIGGSLVKIGWAMMKMPFKKENAINPPSHSSSGSSSSSGRGKPKYPSSGGSIGYFSDGGESPFEPKGTDTVPAMLTPGEFVVNADAASKNRDLLERINGAQGFASGGTVGTAYLAFGGAVANAAMKGGVFAIGATISMFGIAINSLINSVKIASQAVSLFGASVSKANPAVMEQTGIVMNDLSGVIGRVLAPAVQTLIPLLRQFADYIDYGMKIFSPSINRIAKDLRILAGPMIELGAVLLRSLIPIVKLLVNIFEAIANVIYPLTVVTGALIETVSMVMETFGGMDLISRAFTEAFRIVGLSVQFVGGLLVGSLNMMLYAVGAVVDGLGYFVNKIPGSGELGANMMKAGQGVMDKANRGMDVAGKLIDNAAQGKFGGFKAGDIRGEEGMKPGSSWGAAVRDVQNVSISGIGDEVRKSALMASLGIKSEKEILEDINNNLRRPAIAAAVRDGMKGVMDNAFKNIDDALAPAPGAGAVAGINAGVMAGAGMQPPV